MLLIKKDNMGHCAKAKLTAAVTAVAAFAVMLMFAGCALIKPGETPATASPESESVFAKYNAVLNPFDGNVSKFDLGPFDDREPAEYYVSDRYVYYLYRQAEKYELKRIDTADPSNSGIAPVNAEGDHFCSLSCAGVRVEMTDEVVFLDLGLNEIYRVPNKEPYEQLIQYKDAYLLMQGDDLSILKDGKLEPFRKLNYSEYGVLTLLVTPDNTKIVFTDNKYDTQVSYYIYDVNADKYEKISEMGYNYYYGGFYEVTPAKITLRDLSEDKPREMTNQFPGTITTSFFDGKKLYLSDQSDLTIKCYDPFDQTLMRLSDHQFDKYGINIIGRAGNKLYFVMVGEIYVINMTGLTETPVEEYNIILHGERDDLEREIRDKYSVNILTGSAASRYLLDNVKAQSVDQETRILYSLKQLHPYIKRFGKEFFDEFRYGTSKGLYVLLTGSMQVTNDGANIDAGGVAFRQGDIFYILLNINNDNPGRSFCHELMHSMEQNADADKFFPDWNKYNPKGFKYADSYAATSDTKYTFDGPDGVEIYFYDAYSKTNAMEDRARVFENVLAVNPEESRINDNQRLKAKASYIKERICKLYPSLKDKDIFRNLEG